MAAWPCAWAEHHGEGNVWKRVGRNLAFSFFFKTRVLFLCSLGWSQILDSPSSASWVLELQACTSTHSLNGFQIFLSIKLIFWLSKTHYIFKVTSPPLLGAALNVHKPGNINSKACWWNSVKYLRLPISEGHTDFVIPISVCAQSCAPRCPCFGSGSRRIGLLI
jgi:hypothetical protein